LSRHVAAHVPSSGSYLGEIIFTFTVTVLFTSAANTSSSSLRSFSLATPSAAPLHSHQERRSSQKNGEEGRKETSCGLDHFRFRGNGSEEVEKGRVSGRICRGHLPQHRGHPYTAVGIRVMFLAFLLHGFSLLTHKFLCGLLFIYGM
jgi:hypothetical protein